MSELSETPQYKIAKITIADKLQQELDSEFNRILAFSEFMQTTKMTLRRLTDKYEPDVEANTKLNTFIENLDDYIPKMELNPDGSPNIYIDSLKEILNESYDQFHETSDILNMLDVSSIDDIAGITELSSNFVESISTGVMSGTFQTIITDFPTTEFQIGSVMALVDQNLGITDITQSLSNIVSISDNLVTNFSEVANLEAIQGMITTLPDTFINAGLDQLGNIDLNSVMESVGIPNLDDIANIANVKDVMNNVVGQVTGQLNSLMGGMGMCGCAIPTGLGDLSGMINQISNIPGQLNSTMQNVIDNSPIGKFNDAAEAVGDIKDKLDTIVNEDLDWRELIKT